MLEPDHDTDACVFFCGLVEAILPLEACRGVVVRGWVIRVPVLVYLAIFWVLRAPRRKPLA